MGWIRITRNDGTTPPWARPLNSEAGHLDPLSDGYIKPPLDHPRTAAELEAIDEQGA